MVQDTHDKMQCWCKTNGDEKTKSIEEAQTKIKAPERGGVESHVSGDMQDIGRLRKKTVGSLGMSFYIYIDPYKDFFLHQPSHQKYHRKPYCSCLNFCNVQVYQAVFWCATTIVWCRCLSACKTFHGFCPSSLKSDSTNIFNVLLDFRHGPGKLGDIGVPTHLQTKFINFKKENFYPPFLMEKSLFFRAAKFQRYS